MSIHVIIDGYNLIRQIPRFAELDSRDILLGRQALVEELVSYKRARRHAITVVFDGAAAPFGSPGHDQVKGIRILFSRQGESADALIETMVRKEREKALVVSSDNAVASAAERWGASVIDSRTFDEKLNLAGMPGGNDREESHGWIPTTRKKGPSKRLPKRKRKSRAKIRKL
jgi:predicted RNA-binding protein with PIN domain